VNWREKRKRYLGVEKKAFLRKRKWEISSHEKSEKGLHSYGKRESPRRERFKNGGPRINYEEGKKRTGDLTCLVRKKAFLREREKNGGWEEGS